MNQESFLERYARLPDQFPALWERLQDKADASLADDLAPGFIEMMVRREEYLAHAALGGVAAVVNAIDRLRGGDEAMLRDRALVQRHFGFDPRSFFLPGTTIDDPGEPTDASFSGYARAA